MSRICVKNLPKYVDEDRLRDHFSQKGEVTDAKIMRTSDGRSRQFAFIGYRTEEEAQAAVKYFHNSYLDTYRMTCEVAHKIGDPNIPRPWSRHSQKKVQEGAEKSFRDKKSGMLKSNKIGGSKENLKASDNEKNDPQLQEFLQVMQPRSKTKLWANDTISDPNIGKGSKPDELGSQIGEGKKMVNVEMVDGILRKVPVGKGKSSEKLTRIHVRFEDDSDEEFEGDDVLENENVLIDSCDGARETAEGNQSNNLARDDLVSDMEYFKSRVTQYWGDDNEGEEKPADELQDDDETSEEEDAEFSHNEHQQQQKVAASELEDRDVDEANNARESFENKEIQVLDDDRATSVANSHEFENSLETGRLFVRNLPYTTTEDDLVELFSSYGEISQVHLVVDRDTKRSKGFAYVLYFLPESALRALQELDKSIFQGRLLHVIPAQQPPPAPVKQQTSIVGTLAMNKFKQEKEEQRKASEAGGDTRAWNSLFMHPDTIAENVARKYGVSKGVLLDPEADDLAVRMALGETHIIAETKKSLSDEGVNVDILEDLASGKLDKVKRSNHILLIKNLPFSTSEVDLVKMFGRFGSLERVILPSTKTLALVVYLEAAEARAAFKGLAYKRYRHVPLYLEWAPESILNSKSHEHLAVGADLVKRAVVEQQVAGISDEDFETDNGESRSVFVKNLNFKTTEASLRKHFEQHMKEGALRSALIKLKPSKNGRSLSLGFGFVEFDTPETAKDVCKNLQGTVLDGHALLLQVSHQRKDARSIDENKAQKIDKSKSSTKIIVRNIAFEATKKDLRQLFSPFGQIKSLRLPKKFDGNHRGFAFVEFITKQEAENAFSALSSSHLYGRHLVLEQALEGESLEQLRARTASQFIDADGVGLNSESSSKKRKQMLSVDEGSVHFAQIAR